MSHNFRKHGIYSIAFILSVVFVVLLGSIPVAAASNTLLSGNLGIVSTANKFIAGTASTTIDNVTENSARISATIVTGKWDALGGSSTATIQLTNNLSVKARLKFSYSATGYSELSLGDSTGNVTCDLEAGTSYTFTIKSEAGRNETKTAYITLSGMSLTAIASADVTVNCDDSLGSIKSNGTGIASGSVISLEAGGTINLEAVANSGVAFMGWVDDSDNSIVSLDSTFDYSPAESTSISARFRSTTTTDPWFLVNNTYLFDNLPDAIATTEGVLGESVIVLLNSATLPAGTYTIPSNTTLLIPYNDAKTLCTTTPSITASTGLLSSEAPARVTPSVYRKLTMAEGAHLVVNGALSLSGTQCSAQGANGMPTGPLSFVQMNANSSITVNSGASLYAWGYITGSGSILIKSGGTVYEDFQLRDWRGGDATTGLLNKAQKVFPVSQYYVQNIEVPMTLESGASEYAYMTLVAGKCFADASIPFIGTDAMFRNSGTITKDYLEDQDRLHITINGNLTMSSLVITADAGITDYTMDSSKYVLPITNNLDVIVNSGTTTISQDMLVLPGSKLTIAEGATVELASGVSLFTYDKDQWVGNLFVYNNCDVSPLQFVGFKMGKPNARPTMDDAQIIVNGTLDASAGYLYTTVGTVVVDENAPTGNDINHSNVGATDFSYKNGNGNICGGEGGVIKIGTASQGVTYQYKQGESKYYEIPVVPAMLKHGDGTYTAPTVANTYIYEDGFWRCADNHDYKEETTEATCTESGWTGSVCQICGDKETGTVLPALGHTSGDVVVENNVPATNSSAGSYDNVTYCTVCGEEASRVTVEVPALCSHDWAYTNCTDPGTCTKCGDTGSARGHSFTNYVSNGDAKCEQDGTKTAKCDHDNCNETDTIADEGSALNHSFTDYVSDGNATCTADGTKTAKCGRCNAIDTIADDGSALGHTSSAAVSENRVESTCTVAGSYDSVVYCSVCHAELSKETKTLDLAAHTEAAAVEENRVESTCTTQGSYDSVVYCSVCNAEMSRETKTLDLAAHTEAAAVEENKKEASCSAEGSYEEVVYCSVCNAELSRTNKTIDKLAHKAGEAVVENKVASTCTVAGSYDSVVYCSVCDEELSRETKALDLAAHTEAAAVEENKKEASCSAEGSYEEVVYCSVCNAELSRTNKTIDKLEHTADEAVEENRVESTCTVAGSYDSVVYCSVCKTHEISRETKTLELAAHTPGEAVEENRVESTCTVAGSYDSVVYCSVCKTHKISTTKEDLPLAAHTPGEAVEENRVESTCTVKGSYDSVVYCSVCKTHEMSRETKTLELAAHTADEAVVENKVASTCTVAGSYDSVVYCSVCNAEMSRETKDLDLATHTEAAAVEENRVESTCTVAGSYDSVVYCSVCNAELSRETKALDLADHTEAAAVEENRVESTCTVAGSYDSVVYCSVCNAEMSRETKAIELAAHTAGAAVEENRVESTCTVAGSYDTVTYCTACKAELSRVTTTVNKKGHTAGTPVTENNMDATCTTDGSYDTVTYCTACKAELSRATTTVNKKGHTAGTPVIENNVDPTCTKDGSYDTVTYCTVTGCGSEVSRVNTTVDKLGHKAGDPVVENSTDAACGVEGSYDSVVYCTTCNEKLSSEHKTVDALPHKYETRITTNPTCTETGIKTFTCSACGDTYTDEVDALGHTLTSVEAKAPTCEDAGYKAYEYCSVCDYTTFEAVDAAGHDYDAVVTAPTCTAGGHTTNTCKNCGNSYVSDEKAATGHTPADAVQENVVAATCQAAGSYDAVVYCSVCNAEMSRTPTPITKLDHTPGTAVEENRVESTCTVAGSYDSVVKCTVCTEELSRTKVDLELAAHTPGEATEENRVESTCTVEGSYDSVVYCSVCNAELSRETKALELAEHTAATAVEENKVASTCTTKGSYDSVVYCSVCDEELSRTKQELPLAAHTEAAAVEENRVESTCTVAGSYNSVVYCSVCKTHKISTTKVDLPLAEHTPSEAVEEDRVESTCTVAGSYNSVVYCSVCDAELSRESKALELADHTPGAAVEEGRVESTCTVAGSYNSVVYCSVCKTYKISSTEVDLPLAEHTPGEAVEENRVESTCTVKGSYDSVVYCSVCNIEMSRETKALELAVHTAGTAVEENRKASTCTVAGSYDSVVYCSVCDAEISRNKVNLELAAHTAGTAVEENRVESTCTVAGSYDSVVYCSVCKTHEISRETKTLDLAAHTAGEAVEENRVESTCTVKGSYDSVVYCSVCNTEMSRETKALELAAHSAGTAVEEDRVESTCTTAGSYDSVVYCSVCNNEISRNTVKLELKAHTEGAVVQENKVSSTCTVAGSYDNVVYCTVCNSELSREKVSLDALNHSFSNYVSDNNATCTENGTKTAKCERCDATDSVEIPDSALDHSFTNYVSDGNATCTADGTETAKCDRCDVTDTRDDKDSALDHSFTKYEYQYDATCTEDGNEKAKCDRCDETHTRKAEGTKVDHLCDEIVTPSTCTVKGYTTYDCRECDYKAIVYTEALGHDFDENDDGVNDGAVTEATCTEGKYTTYTCLRSGCTHSEKIYDEENTALGHAEVTHEAKAPTCNEVGWDAYVTCSRCDYTTYAEKAQLEHSYSSVVTAPTCDKGGITTHTCSLCGNSYTSDPTSATGDHKDEDLDNRCDTCDATMCGEHNWDENEIVFKWIGTRCVAIRTCTNSETPHTETIEAVVRWETIPATCTEAGGAAYIATFDENSFVPEDMREQVNEDEIVVYPATGHSMTHVEAKEPTCTANGNVEHYNCSNCKMNFADEAGENKIENVVIGATGHSYTSEVTAPTCIARGYTTKTCSVCRDSYKTNYVKALGHRPVTDPAEAPKCTETGLSEGKHCSVCNAIIVAQSIVPATGHQYDSDTDVTCNICGADRRLDCEHEYSVDNCDEIYRWKQCSKCTAINEESRTERKYTITFQGFEGGQDITLQGTYAYDYIITVPAMESYYFEFEGAWTVDGQVLTPKSKLSLGAFRSLITSNSDEIYVEGTYKISGLKPDAVLMNMQYGDAIGTGNVNVFMSISLFLNVEDDMAMPVVSIGGQEVTGKKIGALDAYYYQIPLEYDDILDPNYKLAVQITYGDYFVSPEFDISIAQYMQALTTMFDDATVAGTKELLEATREYVKALQDYNAFKNNGSIELESAPYFEIDANNKDLNYFGEAHMNGDTAIAKFLGANVEFKNNAYALLYRFTMNLPEGATLDNAYIILTDSVDTVNRTQKWEGTKYAYAIVTETEDGVQHQYNQVKISDVPASEMAVRYATVYLVYRDANGEECFAYSETLKYGVTTYLNRQIDALQYGEINKEIYKEEREWWLMTSMFDKLRALAGLADPLSFTDPSDTPDTDGSTSDDSADTPVVDDTASGDSTD